MSYEDITGSKACIDELERLFGTSHAEQAAHLYEDCDDPDEYNINALREIEEFMADQWEEDPDAEYIRSRARTVIAKLDAEALNHVLEQQALEEGHTIKLELKLDAMIALAVGSEREELLPSEERIAEAFRTDSETTANEAALMANLEGWVKMAVEASRALIQFKQRFGKAQQELEEAEERFAVVQQELKAITKHARRADHVILRQRQWPEDVGCACLI